MGIKRLGPGALIIAALAAAVMPASAPADVLTSPSSMTFAPQEVGTTSAPQTATVTVTCGVMSMGMCMIPGGFSTAGTFSGANPGDFAQTNDCGPGQTATTSPETCTFTVTFVPTAAGTRTATLTLGFGGSPVPSDKTIDLTGTATAPPAVPTPPTGSTSVPSSTAPSQTAGKKCKKKGKKAGAAGKCKKKRKK